MSGLRLKLLIVAALAMNGCTYVNKPLSPVILPLEQRARNQTRAGVLIDSSGGQAIDTDGFFIGIAISGGGSRSANFSAACFFELQRLGLLQHVDYISSVSGGSLTAAYYCLNDADDWNPQNVQQELTHSFAGDIIFQSMIPWNFVTLMLSDWDRTDLLADSFRANLFTHGAKTQTFADLRDDRPRLLLNATDLQSGRRFVFSNESFDRINSDLSQYPIASAVAASAAFPVVMHHLTLRDFSTNFKQYVHLIDGGVTDNLGVETLVETYEARVAAARAAGRCDPYPNGAILLVIDARTTFNAKLSDRGDIGFLDSLKAGTTLTSASLLARASSATMADVVLKYSSDDVDAKALRQQTRELEQTGQVTMRDRNGKPARIVHLALRRVDELTNLPFASFSDSVNNIATYFAISDAEAFNLFQAAKLLIEEKFEPALREIVRELDGKVGLDS